jgi:hypothetical protein
MSGVMNAARHGFDGYVQNARALSGVSMAPAVQENFITEVYQKGLLAEIVQEATGLAEYKRALENATTESDKGRVVLAEIVRTGVPVHVPARALSRGTRQAQLMIDQQVGRSGSNLWNAHNAVTYHVDHIRGRTADSGVTAAHYGAGEQLKNRSLNLARDLAGRASQASITL